MPNWCACNNPTLDKVILVWYSTSIETTEF